MLSGDSITRFWGGDPKAAEANGPASWQATFGPYRTLNLGFGWVHIGTNNTSNTEHARKNPRAGITEGARAIFRRLSAKTPEAGMIFMAVFPRERMPDHPVASENSRLALV